MSPAADALDGCAAALPDGAGLLAALPGPFRRAIRVHPRRGVPSGWGELHMVPWHAGGRFTPAEADPGDFLDHHCGVAYAQDAASQVPVLLLDPRPGETVVDACAAPGSKSTQIGLALGDDGLLICSDAAAPRRRVVSENLARQGITCAVVTPMPLHVLADRHRARADAVLVDAPCSGHQPRSERQVARMGLRQGEILACAARLVRPGGRLVYSTCTPYAGENEAVIARFLECHPGWSVERMSLPGCDTDLLGAGGVRLWPQRQGTEPFFACRLRAPSQQMPLGLSWAGTLPMVSQEIQLWLDRSSLHCWRNGNTLFVGSVQAASCAVPSEARGLILGHGRPGWLRLDAWGAQALIERGAEAITVSHSEGLRLWAGEALDIAGHELALVKTQEGAPLGQLSGLPGALRLALPSRLRRNGLR